MNKIAKVLLGVTLVLVIAIVVASQLISTQDIVEQISTQVKQSTGRDLAVEGEAKLEVFPSLAVELNQVKLANMVNASWPQMVSMDKMTLNIPWLAVFTGQLEIDKFVLHQPNIYLEVSPEGKANWHFFSASSDKKDITTDKTDAINLPEAFDLSLGQVEIKNGSLIFANRQSGQTHKLNELGLAIELPSLRQDLRLEGELVYLDEKFDLTLSLSTPEKLLTNQAFDTELTLNSKLVNLDYQGKIEEQGNKVSGRIGLQAPSLKDILAWQNIALDAKPEAYNQFSLASKLLYQDSSMTLQDIELSLDKLSIKGNSQLAIADPFAVTADIDLGELDLNPYLNLVEEKETAPIKKSENESEAQAIVWDDSAIDLSALSALNLDVTVRSESLKAKKIKLGKNHLALTLAKGRLDARLEEFNAYQGVGKGQLTLDSQSKPYKLFTRFSLDNVNAEPLLTDVIGFDKLIGSGQVSWQLTSQGQSQKQFIDALNGDIGFSFKDGAIKGVNLGAIARSAGNVLKGNLKEVDLDRDFSNSQKTDFAALKGSFDIAKGVAKSQDISLVNPFIRTSGNGTIDLPQTKLSFKVKTKLVASATGQTGQQDESGITIPIKIKGPFHKIKVKPDLSSQAKDKLKEKVKDKLKKLFGD